MNETFETLNVQERRAAEEESFAQWVNDGGKKRVKRYGNALTDISESVNNRKDAYYMITYLTETVGRIELSSISARISHLVRRMSNAQTPEEKEKILSAIEGSIESFYKDYSLATDIKVAKTNIIFFIFSIFIILLLFTYHLTKGKNRAKTDFNYFHVPIFS